MPAMRSCTRPLPRETNVSTSPPLHQRTQGVLQVRGLERHEGEVERPVELVGIRVGIQREPAAPRRASSTRSPGSRMPRDVLRVGVEHDDPLAPRPPSSPPSRRRWPRPRRPARSRLSSPLPSPARTGGSSFEQRRAAPRSAGPAPGAAGRAPRRSSSRKPAPALRAGAPLLDEVAQHPAAPRTARRGRLRGRPARSRRRRGRPCRRSGTARRTAAGTRSNCARPRPPPRARPGPPPRTGRPPGTGRSGCGSRRTRARLPTTAGRLPIDRAESPRAARPPPGRVVGRRDHLDPRRPFRRVEPVHPAEPPASRSTNLASSSIGSDEVFETITASDGGGRRADAQDLLLEPDVLGHRLEDELGPAGRLPASPAAVDPFGALDHLLGQQPGLRVAPGPLDEPLLGLAGELGRRVGRGAPRCRRRRSTRRPRGPSCRRR